MARRPAQPVTVHSIAVETAQSARDSGLAIAALCHDDGQQFALRLEDPQTGQHLETTVPAAALRLLIEALGHLADGHAVSLVPVDTELSTQQAADMMGVSRPYLVKLLEQGELPFRKVGAQRRVRLEALRRFMAGCEADGTTALAAMASEAQRMGLYG